MWSFKDVTYYPFHNVYPLQQYNKKKDLIQKNGKELRTVPVKEQHFFYSQKKKKKKKKKNRQRPPPI